MNIRHTALNTMQNSFYESGKGYCDSSDSTMRNNSGKL